MLMPDASSGYSFRFVRNVLAKTLVLLLAANLLFALVNPMPFLGKVTLYNWLFPGRLRLPFGEDPGQAYNLSLFSLDAMFASQAVSRPKAADEFRLLVVGDSSVWGILLPPGQTLAGLINAAGYKTPDGRQVRAYNLGYPTLSLTKDLLVLDWARRFQPDMIVWPVTLQSFPRDQQLSSPILQHNPQEVRRLIQVYPVNLNPQDPALVDPSFWQQTLFGQSRNLADILRLQVFGALWAATGIDQYYPESYELRANDLAADPTFDKLNPPHLAKDALAFDVLEAGMSIYKDIPVLLVNEPMFISNGSNSNIRYNFYYPRWAYDDYRQLLSAEAQQNQWHYLDLWNAILPAEFTNSAIHLTPAGSAQLAGLIGQAMQELIH
jgi:hypothetical protein